MTEKPFDWERFVEYINTYPTDTINHLSNISIIRDIIYGIGLSLNEEEYQYRKGFLKFIDHLKNDILNHESHPDE